MGRQLSRLGLSTVAFLAAATARADWLDLRGLRGDEGVAILSPVETGPPPQGAALAGCFCNFRPVYTPYYSPLTPISVRWRACRSGCGDVYVHYYPGYRPKGQRGSNLFVPGGDPLVGPAWARPAGAHEAPISAACAVGDYGSYSSAPADENCLRHLGGNGPAAPCPPRNPDLIDIFQGGVGGPCRH